MYPSEASRHSPASSRCCGNLASPPEPQHPTSRLPGCESERPRSRRTERQLRRFEGRARQTALGRDRRSSASDCDRPLWRRPFEPLSGRSWPTASVPTLTVRDGYSSFAETDQCELNRQVRRTPYKPRRSQASRDQRRQSLHQSACVPDRPAPPSTPTSSTSITSTSCCPKRSHSATKG
jgi:hypothetical protein